MSWLLWSCRFRRAVKAEKGEGTGPVRLLDWRYRADIKDNRLMEEGIGPTSRLPEASISTKRVNEPISEGMDPVIRFREKDK
jgi:hypothetical protein